MGSGRASTSTALPLPCSSETSETTFGAPPPTPVVMEHRNYEMAKILKNDPRRVQKRIIPDAKSKLRGRPRRSNRARREMGY
jgi:hypothetical protein